MRHQAQFKLQMQIRNEGRHTLDIRQTHIRLVVSEFDSDRWSPPRIGEATTDRPIRTTYLGKHVWAVPPNAEDAYDVIPNHPGIATFATHWGRHQLDPGQTFHPDYHYGDLVFYVPSLPHDRNGSAAIENVIGIAYVEGRDIVVLCPREHWGPRKPAASF